MVRAALRLTVAAAACATMSLSCVWPAEFEPDAGTPAPPYVVWDSAFPAFLPTQAFNEVDKANFTVTVGDANVDLPLKVRFCERKTTQGTGYLVVEKLVDPSSPKRKPDRTPVQTDNFNPCGFFSSAEVPPGAIRYLYVVVTDGSFTLPSAQCDVAAGLWATAAWPFTCDKPLSP